jgi:glycosyltransferase involved in cell wall biosynthesis
VPYLADASLSLINRTGAHYLARDIIAGLPQHFAAVRYWRHLGELPTGLRRKISGRLMLLELEKVRAPTWLHWPKPTGFNGPILFLDPLYVLNSSLAKKDVVLCHDVGPLSHPDLYDTSTVELYREAYEKIRSVGPAIVFVSEFSKKAFTDLFGFDFAALHCISLYVRAGTQAGPIQPVEGVRRPFLLTVGAFERRKNLPTAVEAYARSGLADRGIGFVLCGARGLDWEEVFQAAQQIPSVRLLSYVSDAELRWLYANASGFVLPSLLEGFGMPALEAAKYGLIPIVTANSALSEAVNGLGIEVDPNDADTIAQGMIDLVNLNEDKRKSRSAELASYAGQQTYDRFILQWNKLLESNDSRGAHAA